MRTRQVGSRTGDACRSISTTAASDHHRHAARFSGAGRFRRSARQRCLALQAAVAPCRAVLDAARAAGMLVIHTREGHRPDLSDAPPHKVERGDRRRPASATTGPMGRILVRGEPGHDIIPELYPLDNEPVIDKPGKGAFYQTDLDSILQNRGIDNLFVARRHHRSLRQHHRARGQRPRLSLHRAGGLLRVLFSGIPRRRPHDDQGAGRHFRLGDATRQRVASSARAAARDSR